ncbi:MAG: TonB-dependent receptor plug domain-containing protein, partial [Candidatus Eisenbacteria bacterium]|nr:TonB-dependent receptor plug domain-containing protein [Candidatus Eisenbacteria bacterium]
PRRDRSAAAAIERRLMPGVRAGGSIVLRANGLRLAYALAILLTFLCPASSAFAEPEWSDRPLDLDRIRRLSLEELMAIDVTSLAGLPKEWFRTPAAIAVLTADDIRRSGLRSLPEILRLVPGMFVGHQTSSFWRAGPRGFTGASLPSPRSLVLIDGRIVYDPLFGGVFWDVQQPVVEEIERIEVIRGPGATLWGPNAVNGVINVITRRASETKGVIVTAGGGSDLRAFGTLRAGASLGSRSSIRAHASGFARDEMHAIGDGGAGDDWSLAQAGFRLDSEPDPRTSLLLESSLYASPTLGARRRVPVDGAHLRYEVLSGDDEVRGGHVLARLGRDLAGAGSLAAQAYLDRADRERIGGLEVDRITADVDLRHDLRWRRGQELLWGIGYRSTSDRTKPGGDIGLDPADRTIELWSGFLQNTSDFARDRLHVMLGSKLTRQTFTGFEAQPLSLIHI